MAQHQIAVDYSRFDRRTKLIEPEVPVELVEKPEQRRVRIKTKLPYKLLATLVVAAAMLVTVILSYNQVWNINAANAALDNEYKKLKHDEQVLLQKTQNGFSQREIEEIAVQEFGMKNPTADQITYIQLNGEDHAEVVESESGLTQFVNWVVGLFK